MVWYYPEIEKNKIQTIKKKLQANCSCRIKPNFGT